MTIKDFEMFLEMLKNDCLDLTRISMEDFNLKIEDCFPYTGTKNYIKDGKSYTFKMEVSIIERR